jgi:Icc-related predicted phosphoesterase
MGRVDVLISHSPPFNTSCDILWDGKHVGSKPLRRYIDRYQPIVVLSGHIHESPGTDTIGKTLVVNPGPFPWYSEVTVNRDTRKATSQRSFFSNSSSRDSESSILRK